MGVANTLRGFILRELLGQFSYHGLRIWLNFSPAAGPMVTSISLEEKKTSLVF